jgi:hypothetical protein
MIVVYIILCFNYIVNALVTDQILLNNNYTTSKYYLRNTTYKDLLYTEVSYIISNNTSTSLEASINDVSYVTYKHYWFLPNVNETNSLSYLKNGWYFYGFSHSKAIGNNITHDLYICKLNYKLLFNKCEDYNMESVDVNKKDIKELFKLDFNPTIDYKNDGIDSIIYYNAYDLITTHVSPYEALLKLDIKIPFSNTDKRDLTFELNNNLTIFYGELSHSIDSNKIILSNFKITDSESVSLLKLISKCNYNSISYMLLFLLLII